jgi:hypothetical protein
MSLAIQKQLLLESQFTGSLVFCVQAEAGENEPRPSDASVKNLRRMIEGLLASRGAEIGPPIVRTSGRTAEISVSVPAWCIGECFDLFSAFERMGIPFRAGRLHADSTWETIYPGEGTEPFALLPEPPSVEDQLAVPDRELAYLQARTAALNERVRLALISDRDAEAQIEHIAERQEAVREDVIRLRTQQRVELCGQQS